jgi:hypothetical protein
MSFFVGADNEGAVRGRQSRADSVETDETIVEPTSGRALLRYCQPPTNRGSLNKPLR